MSLTSRIANLFSSSASTNDHQANNGLRLRDKDVLSKAGTIFSDEHIARPRISKTMSPKELEEEEEDEPRPPYPHVSIAFRVDTQPSFADEVRP